jgi:hypothetical protein
MVGVARGSLVDIESLMPQEAPEARLEGWSRLNAIAARPYRSPLERPSRPLRGASGRGSELVSRCFT